MSESKKTVMSEANKTEKREVAGRKTLIGHVVSAKMKDTIVVTEERLVKHALYKKYVRKKSRFVAHDAGNTAKEGDEVEIMQTRPMSKTKNWRLVRVVRRSHGAVVHADVDVAAEAIGRKADAVGANVRKDAAVAPEAKS